MQRLGKEGEKTNNNNTISGEKWRKIKSAEYLSSRNASVRFHSPGMKMLCTIFLRTKQTARTNGQRGSSSFIPEEKIDNRTEWRWASVAMQSQILWYQMHFKSNATKICRLCIFQATRILTVAQHLIIL